MEDTFVEKKSQYFVIDIKFIKLIVPIVHFFFIYSSEMVLIKI